MKKRTIAGIMIVAVFVLGMTSSADAATMLGDNEAVITSYATAVFSPPAVKEQTIYLNRSTMVIRKIAGKWLIVHMQVSALPAE